MENETVTINADVVGTFYNSPEWDDKSNEPNKPFVKIGSYVEPDTVVARVEALLALIEQKSKVRGTIVEILVEDGQEVNYGDPLFKVQT